MIGSSILRRSSEQQVEDACETYEKYGPCKVVEVEVEVQAGTPGIAMISGEVCNGIAVPIRSCDGTICLRMPRKVEPKSMARCARQMESVELRP